MSDDCWIVVPNWDKFQHYSDRNPVWIKLYLELRDRDDWSALSYAQRGLLVTVWMEFGASRGVLRCTSIARRSGQRTRKDTLDSLAQAGFIQLSASRPSPHAASVEVEKRREDLRAGARAHEGTSAHAPALNGDLLARFDAWVKYEGYEYVDDHDAFVDELRRRKFIPGTNSPLAGELLERARQEVAQ